MSVRSVQVAELLDAVEHGGGFERQRVLVAASSGALRSPPTRPASTPSAARGCASEYAHTVVLWLSFWLQSTNTRPVPLLLRHVDRDALRVPRLEQLPEREREPLRRPRASRRRCSAGTERCSPLPPEVFTTAIEVELVEQVAQRRARRGSSRARRPARRGRGRARRPSGATGRPPSTGGCAARARRGSPARRAPASSSIDAALRGRRRPRRPRSGPIRVVRRAALLEEPLARRAVGRPHQRRRPAGQVRQHHRRDPAVVVDHVGFREPRGRVEHLVEVRERQLATARCRREPLARVRPAIRRI